MQNFKNPTMGLVILFLLITYVLCGILISGRHEPNAKNYNSGRATLKLQQIFKITNIFPNIHNKKNIYGVNESTTMELLLLHKIPVSPVVPLYET
uniref:Uncharacterized protein n=1 Tax=Wuchereria bancrofti TaxID=6293 RepID=A0A1I8EYB4_WUCBA